MLPTLLLTRPPTASRRVLAAVEKSLGCLVPHVISPIMRIVPVAATVPAGASVVLTSQHGARRAADLGLTGRAWCVGLRTARVAQDHGFTPLWAQGNADDLIRLIRENAPPGEFVHIHGRHTRGNVAARLTQAGFACTGVVAYDQVEQPLSPEAHDLLNSREIVVLPLFSPRSAQLFMQNFTGAATLRPVAISAAVAECVNSPVHIATQPDMKSMVTAICTELKNGSLC